MAYKSVQVMYPAPSYNHSAKRRSTLLLAQNLVPNYKGKVLIMNKIIYSLQSASASFHKHCAQVLYKIGFKPLHTDPDLWMKDCQTL